MVHTVITLRLAERALERRDEDAPGLVSEAISHAQGALEDPRDLSHGILPVDLSRGGLRGGADAVVERLALPVGDGTLRVEVRDDGIGGADHDEIGARLHVCEAGAPVSDRVAALGGGSPRTVRPGAAPS